MLSEELRLLLRDIKGNKLKGTYSEEHHNYEDLETLVEFGYANAIDVSSKSGKAYLDPSITFKGKELLRTESVKETPTWKSWDNGWKKWIGAIVLICAAIFALHKLYGITFS
ncbi:hypothetical protein [Paraglaciecola polaris]|uniref:hypothetical protein n=1 Tax=Paraglaciecola polaris TaxID=222814 RepID=UPI0005910426|nr:hypothetical protein [Paraglaciecola polaris]